MTIKFPKEEKSFSPQDAQIAHKHLVDYHLHFLKLQSKCEFFYWKLMGVFFLASMGAFILRDKGIIVDPLIAISIVGLGCLLVFAQTVRMDLQYAVGAASCVEKGILIEDNPKKPDFDTKQKLLDDAWDLFLNERLDRKVSKLIRKHE